MTAVSSGGYEFAQFVSDHIFCNQYRHVLPAIVDGHGETQHFRRNHGTPGPGLDRPSVIFFSSYLHFLQKMQIYERTFFKRSWHVFTLPLSYLVALRRRTINLLVRLLVLVL